MVTNLRFICQIYIIIFLAIRRYSSMNELWIVRFVRKDGKPDEEYYYRSLAEAEYHKNLFLDDDSGLYERIEIINDKH